MRQVTKEEAIAIARREGYKSWTPEQVVAFQLEQDKLCMDFGFFHEMVEKVLGRSVWTHEFARPDLLKLELLKIRKKPSLEEILNQIPKDKLIVCLVDEPRKEPSQ